ncbi:MAG: MBL fold metallo-hydrolase [Solirubrobacterales bacterium]|nr:MBL fold metallo-hydrolase [Solirubrobacterales bacterium]
MRVRWFGQSAFRLIAGDITVVIDPFGDTSGLASRGIRFEYPPLDGVEADLLLITHEHGDHNGREVIGGDPVVVRSTAGRFESPIGEVLAVASEHDAAAGTERGPNTIFVFELDGLRIAHFGDFGQRSLRDEQAAAIGSPDMILIPVGAGPTIGPEGAAEIVARLRPRWVVPMHYRTPKIGFLEPADPFLELIGSVHRPPGSEFDTESLPAAGSDPLAIVPEAP